MTLIALLIGAILIVVALRNSYGALGTALYTDVPAFITWAAAIIAVGAIGFIPGLKPISRGLMGLVITVLILTNYRNILNGFQASWQSPPPVSTTASGAFDASGSAGVNLGGGSGLTNFLGGAGNSGGAFGTGAGTGFVDSGAFDTGAGAAAAGAGGAATDASILGDVASVAAVA